MGTPRRRAQIVVGAAAIGSTAIAIAGTMFGPVPRIAAIVLVGLVLAVFAVRPELLWASTARAVGPGPKTSPRTEERRYEAALSNVADAVVLIGPDGSVEYANPTARAFLQQPRLEATRRLGQPDIDRLVAEARLRREPTVRDAVLLEPAARPARARAIPLADGTTIVLLSDLSETFHLDRMRRDFVANVSHELKTPLAAIRALTETAETAFAANDIENARRFIGRLGSEAMRVSDLVTDLLDLSRVESGLEFSPEPTDVAGILAVAADRARPLADAKQVTLCVESPPIVADVDPAQLAMAVNNLVDNAVRYSDDGVIAISASVSDRSVAIRVADQGRGVPATDIHRIFERFYRVDEGRSRATGGTGLGLAIVRHIAEHHGGRIDVESEIGIGSTFTMTIPLTRWHAPT